MATKSGLFMTTDKLPKVMQRVKRLPRRDVLVGFPEDSRKAGEERGPQAGSNARDDTPLLNAQIAYIHDNGAPDVNIPRREFMRPGIKEGAAAFTPFLKRAADAMLAGKMDAVDKNLHAAGLAGQNAVRMKIKSGPFVPLAPATVAARRRRSKGSSYRRKATAAADTTPLVDTGEMLKALTYVVRGGAK